MTYAKLRAINVSDNTKKKGALTYLSWTWAVDELMQQDETATWDFPEPKYYGETVMVFCNVTAFGKIMKMQLPVMDMRNNAVANPDSRKISDATMRCLAKCIACFGIGLYVYANQDLPETNVDEYIEQLSNCTTNAELLAAYTSIAPMFKTDPKAFALIRKATDVMKSKLKGDN